MSSFKMIFVKPWVISELISLSPLNTKAGTDIKHLAGFFNAVKAPSTFTAICQCHIDKNEFL